MTEVSIVHTPNPDGTIDLRLYVDGEVEHSRTVDSAASLSEAQGEMCGKACLHLPDKLFQ